MDNSVGGEKGTSPTTAGRMLHLLDEHKVLVISLFLIAIANHAWSKRNERHKNERRSENRRRAVEEKRREAERIWGNLEVKTTQVEEGSKKPLAMHSVAGACTSAQHTETLTAGPSTSIGQLPANERSKERRRRGRDVSKDVRRKGSKRPVAGNGKSSTEPNEQEPFLKVARSESRSSGTTSYERRNPSCSSSAARSAYDFEDEARPGTSGRAPDHNPVDAPATSTMPPTHPDDDEVRLSTMHSIDITLKPDTGEYEVPGRVYDAETRSSMSDSVSSLGISTHTSSNTSDNGDVSDLQIDSAADDKAQDVDATTPYAEITTHRHASSTSSVLSSSSIDSAAEPSLSLDAIPLPISQPVPNHLKSQLHWLSTDSTSTKEQHLNFGTRPESYARMPSSTSTMNASTSDASHGWDNSEAANRHVLKSKSPPPRFRSRSRAPSSPKPPSSIPSTPALSINGFETPPPNASLQTQVTAYRGALEAARQREILIKNEAETYKQECERLKKELSEESERRNGTEAELQAQLQYALSQLRSMPFAFMANAGAHPHIQPLPVPQQFLPNQQPGFSYQSAPHTSFPFTSPYSPHQAPAFSTPPTGATMPLPMAYPSSFPFTPAHYPSAHDGLSHPSAPTSKVTSPTRDTTFTALSLNGHDSPSIGGPHPLYIDKMRANLYGYADQDEDDTGSEYISPLEEAILKRPASMRSPSRASGSRSTSGGGGSVSASASASTSASVPSSSSASRTGSSRGGSRSASVAGGATREGILTFASLSELGNPQWRDGSPQVTDPSVNESDEAQDSQDYNDEDTKLQTVPLHLGLKDDIATPVHSEDDDTDTTPRSVV